MRWLWAALPALLLGLPGTLLLASVPAPQKVRVRCGDQRPVVSWDYSSQRPTNFSVRHRKHVVKTADRELDLSALVWKNSEMLNFNFVTVTAEQGLERSRSVESPSFSYNGLKSVNVTCRLTFPTVNFSRDGAEATLSFENPLHFYPELKTMKTSAEFSFRVAINNKMEPPELCGRKPICKLSLDVPEDVEPCVNLTGAVDKGAEQILVQHIGPVCATAPPGATDSLWLVVVLSFVLFIFVVSLLTFAICKTRAWVFPKTSIPQTLASIPSIHKSTNSPSETVYSSVQIIGTRPQTIEDLHSPCPEVLDEDQVLIQDLCDEYESGGSTRTETLSLHSSSSDVEESNYERRTELVQMDMSGDLVKGYTS